MKNKALSVVIIMLILSSCVSGGVSETEQAVSDTNETGQSEEVDMIPETASRAELKLDTEFQTMIGFGAGFTWYSDWMLKVPELKEEMADLLFKDAKMTILRFKNEYGYENKTEIKEKSRETQIYNLALERLSEFGEKPTVLMSCWSPPKSLKSNDNVNGGGTLKKNESGEYMYAEYGEWWADSVEQYENAGVPIDYLSIQNECDFTASYDGMELAQFETEQEAAYSKAFLSTYNALKDRFGGDMPLMLAPETMSVDTMLLKMYMKDILDAEPASVAGIAHHLYVGGTSEDADGRSSCDPESFNTNFRENYAAFGADYPIWQTEFFRGTPLQTAALISNSLTVGNLSAYVHWTGVWDGRKPRHDIINVTSLGEYTYGSVYWVMRHFSEFIRPGYIRVQVEYSIKDGYKVAAFKSPDSSKLAVVFVNPTDTDIEVALPIANYTIAESTVYQSVIDDDVYDSGEYYVNLGSLPQNKTLTLKAQSVSTIDITGSNT